MTKSLRESTICRMHILSSLLLWKLISYPPKLLLQLKSVCSLWRGIVSDRDFIKKQLDFANDVHNRHKRRYITTDEAPRIQFQSTTLEGEEPRNENTRPKKTFSPNVEILGSCNGLILLGDNISNFYLWNPSTRACSAFDGRFIFQGEYRNIALGYDSKTWAYKVVRIVRVASANGHLRKMGGFRPPLYDKNFYDATTAIVYNCKTGSWNKIKDFPYVIFEDACGVTMDGFPHWVMFRNPGQDKAIDLVIVYFDLSEETFKEICKPQWLVPSSKFEFGVFEEKLCFIHYTEPSDEVWVMPKHGELWIKLSSEVDVAHVRLPGWSSGHIGDEMKNYYRKAFTGAMYVESLVSPLGGKQMIG